MLGGWCALALTTGMAASAMAMAPGVASPERIDADRVAVRLDQRLLAGDRDRVLRDIGAAASQQLVSRDQDDMRADKLRLIHDASALEADEIAADRPLLTRLPWIARQKALP